MKKQIKQRQAKPKQIQPAAIAIAAAIGISLAFSFTGCAKLTSQLDVVGQQSIPSFDKILKIIPDQVSADEMNAGWSLAAPDGMARFIWSMDYSRSPMHDVMLEISAEPFTAAGLEPDKLPEDYAFYEGMLMMGQKLGSDVLTYEGDPTPLAAYEQIVSKYRTTVGYHASLDHYNVDIGGGNLFEWAKDMSLNASTGEEQDKDIVFVLNPDPFIAAGVDPERVDGWAYAQVSVDIDGKPTDVWKFLKPFNL
ncbi:MAG: hypothetical protein LBT44_08070 [Clostridiales bacterium]|jgi:hypothetical protein|nr:hypothetical protein [Clostridiales bacterium]